MVFVTKRVDASHPSIYEYVSRLNANLTVGYTDFFNLDKCLTKGIKMFKLAPLLILLCSLPVSSFAQYGGDSRTIPLQTFKDRFTTGELISLSTAYAGDAHIRAAISNLKSMEIVNLDSDDLKKDVSYLTSKSILSEDRAKDILR
jgi:hypothetical protein